jgi:hypothetical protein
MTSALVQAASQAASLAARAGGSVVRQIRSVIDPASTTSAGAADEPASRWLVVTVYREPTEVDTGQLPAPLAELGDRIEIQVRPAADGKGTEVAARMRDPAAKGGGREARDEVRSALRRAKQLIEVGEVLAVDPTPHGKRTATPGGVLLETVTRRAGKEGVL